MQPAPSAGAKPPVLGGTIIAAARVSQPAQQPAVAATQPMSAMPTFQPMQVLQVQNQVNKQGQIVGQMYGVAAVGR